MVIQQQYCCSPKHAMLDGLLFSYSPTQASFPYERHRRLHKSYNRRRRSCLAWQLATRNTVVTTRSAAQETGTDTSAPASAADAVNRGLSLFKKGRVKDALVEFNAALEMNPEPEVMQAALYNKACCHTYRDEGGQACDALRKALRDYGLKFSVILNDPDMAPFRGTQEFKQLQDEAQKGGQDVGPGFRRDLKLIGEVQAPFRGVRKVLYVVFTAAAGVSTIVNSPRLFRAFQGGDNAPNLFETAQNMGINFVGIIIFVTLFIWDTKKEEEQIARISRDETLSRLPVRLASNRIFDLVQLRESTRPIILAGQKDAVQRALQKADKYRTELLNRGVLLLPLVWSSTKEEPSKKKGFGGSGGAGISRSVVAADNFEARARSVAGKTVEQAERRLKAEVVSPLEWESWVQGQQEAEGVKPGEDVYIVLRLDGRIRKSGVGMPDWDELIKELPPLDALLSKLER